MPNRDLFSEDASLPGQYWERFANNRDLEPEKRLLAAVLDDAVKNYRKLLVCRGRLFNEEEAWLFSDDNTRTFSFRNICDVLGLSASRLRQSLRAGAANDGANRTVDSWQPRHARKAERRPQIARLAGGSGAA